MRKLLATATAALAVGLSLAAPAAAQAADVGDGSLVCNAGEICFSDAAGGTTTTGVKHFFYGANHAGLRFNNGVALTDHIGGYRNLDTQCTVFVWDVNSFGTWYVYSRLGTEYPGVRSTTSYRGYSSGDRDRNNGHTRCQGTSHP